MNYKRFTGMAVLFLFLVFPASASMVSLLLVETGLNERAPRSQVTSAWEGGLLSAFFDAGYIVTNSPIARVASKPSPYISGSIERDFNDAILGGADFFILGFVEYRLQNGRPVPVEVALKVYSTNTKKLLYEQNFPAGTGRNLADEYRFAQDAGRVIVSHLR